MICANYKELIIPEKLKSPNWEKALEWLKGDSWKDLPPGKTEIDGPRIYALRQSYTSKLRKDCRYEGHRLYADVQMVIKGSDLVLVCLRDDLKIAEPYSAERDIDFLEGEPDKDKIHEVVLGFPMAAVLFPWDIHMPCVAPDDKPGEIEKVVLKVALQTYRD
jgi:YhcH/YjgK/YiaL family protein